MRDNAIQFKIPPTIVGAGLVVLDIIINNGSQIPIFSAGGTCGNVLAGLSFFGWESISISRIGRDLAGDILIKDLSQNSVNVNYITKEENIQTPRIVERLSSNGLFARHSFLLRCPTCHSYLPRFRSPRLDAVNGVLENYTNPDVFFFDRVSPSTLKLARIYRESGALILFEPNTLKYKDKFEEAIQLSHIVKYAGNENTEDMKQIGCNHMGLEPKSCGPLLIIKTLGKYGALFKLAEGKKWHYQESYKPKKIYDTCGAGDWCTVGFLFYLLRLAGNRKKSLLYLLKHYDSVRSSLKFAQMLSSLSLEFVGARGLSISMHQKTIFEKVISQINENIDLALPLVNIPTIGHRRSVLSYKKKQRIHECETCLLSKKAMKVSRKENL